MAQDVTYTLTQNNLYDSFYLCADNTSLSPTDCSDFEYLIVSPSDLCTANSSYVTIRPSFNNSYFNTNVSYCYSSTISLTVDSVKTSRLYFTGGSGGTVNGSVTFTLTDSISGQPSGSLSITENGTFDVSSYAQAVVDVPPEVVQGDYHDDLVSIKAGIYTVGAILLVLYFFYCIYRVIIRSTGGRQ